MVEQNGGKFRRIKKIAFGRNQNKRKRHCLMCRFGSEKKTKFVMGTFDLKKSKKNNFAGGPGHENFIRC